MSAAAGALPVPRVLDRVEVRGCTGALLERLPGRPAGEFALASPKRAEQAGLACGRLHARLSDISAPVGLREVGTPGLDRGPRLLHLDLHPFNVLVDDAGDVTGVIDWANAASGDPVLDKARSWSILMLDPAAVRQRANAGWMTLTQAWVMSGGLEHLPAAARAWACEFMLDDLAKRHSRAELAPVAQALSDARTQSSNQPSGTSPAQAPRSSCDLQVRRSPNSAPADATKTPTRLPPPPKRSSLDRADDNREDFRFDRAAEGA
jgi:Ser/Thr protein kinase RdoA (MazF antagonist)